MKKTLLTITAALLLVLATVMGTMAYLTSHDTVTNTFTVGKVAIKLDEAKVDANGSADTSADRVHENSYHLLPGHTYTKDPTVTVISGSESSYVRMIVTVTKYANLTAAGFNGFGEGTWFSGYNATKWNLKEPTKTAENGESTCTYEFWYKETVAAATSDVVLDALFDSITIPGSVDNTTLAAIADMKITVTAHAIQADGFDNADAAWAAFDANR